MKEKEMSELRFSKLISSMQEAVLVENERREISLVNQAFCDMFDYNQSPESLVGLDCNAAEEVANIFKHPQAFALRLEEILKEKKTVLGEEVELVDGRWLERDYVPVFADETYIGHMWKYRDITNQKKMIRNLFISKKEVEDKNKVLVNFARVVSNDLKAPLRGINSLAEWILEDLTEIESEEVKYNLTLMKGRIHKMEKLIKDIMEYSKIGLGNTPFEICDLNEILDDVAFEYLGSKKVSVEKTAELPTMWVKRPAMYRLFSNLITNAVQHSKRKKIRISISHKEVDDYVEFKVTDNGPGIPDEHKRTIFEMFSVLDPSNKNKNSGVGLPIVERVVERHHGFIFVESKPNKGASFIFTIRKDLGLLEFKAA